MLNFDFFQQYQGSYWTALGLTLKLSILVILCSTVLGSFVYALGNSKWQIGKIQPLRIIAGAFIEIMRGTPVLLQIMLVYSGTKMALNIDFSAYDAALLALSLNASVYIAEVIRAGIQSVPVGQIEASRSLGMSKSLTMLYIVIPQAVKSILPALGNEFVAIIKESSMASAIGVAELTFTAKVVTGATFNPMAPLIVSAIFYFTLTFTIGRIIKWIEARSNKAGA